MKSNNTFFFFFFFFFFLFALFGFITAEYIYDSDGDILNNGGSYYILPPGDGGVAIKGATISGSKRSSCSLAVVAATSDEEGWAAKIETPYPLNYITNDYPLNISFARLPSNACTNTPNWIVTNVLGFNGDPIMVGDFKEFGLPRSGYFYIKPYDSTQYYKFAFCYSTASCGYVTLKTDSLSHHRLTVSLDRSQQPLVFKFVKATSEVASGISMVV